jgi:hypothetical protein
MVVLSVENYSSTMKIHALFILNEAGSCIYNRLFTKKFEDLQVNLITPFFSAILSFSETVTSRQLEVLDLGDLRFVFQIKNNFIFVILSDSTENLLFVNKSLEKIIDAFLHGLNTLDWNLIEVIESPKFDKLIDMLIYGEDEILEFKSNENFTTIIEFFVDLIRNKEIIGAALLTSKGTTLYSSLTKEVFARSMRELEIRYQTKALDIKEHLFVLADNQKVSEIIIDLGKFSNMLLIIQFPPITQLGMADFNTEMIVENLKKTLAYLG